MSVAVRVGTALSATERHVRIGGFVAALLGGWELYADLGGVDDFILPAPSQIATALWDDRSLLWSNLLVTALPGGTVVAVGTAGNPNNASTSTVVAAFDTAPITQQTQPPV